MALQVNITNINSVTYPVQIYVCKDCPNTDCTLVDTINSVPATITIPSPYDTYPLFGVKIIDDVGCEYCQTFQGTTTTSTTLDPICQTCDIGFDFYDTNPVGVISVGLITASCDPSVTDYVIEWYGPGIGSTNIAFTSGYGTDYLGDYTYDHPLIGSGSIPIIAGIYTPIIQKIKINGTEYTDLNCFDSTTVNVDALTCVNGTGSTNPYYSHGISFSATTLVTPQPINTTFALDPLKPYFAYSFKGEQIYDDLKITLFGSNYPDPIVLEYISMGTNQTETNFSLSINPKTIKTTAPTVFFPKVLCLTGLTINSGDYLEIEVTPNPLNNNTNWSFFCECLETFDCGLCYDTTKPPLKIIEASITKIPWTCNGYYYNFEISGCQDSDIFRYLNPLGPGIIDNTAYNGNINGFIYNQTPYNFSTAVLYNLPTVGCSNPFSNVFNKNCDVPTTSTITYQKTISLGEGLIDITFSDYTDLEHYKNNWDYFYTNYGGNPVNPLDVDYYRYFNLSIPLATGAQQCGDLTGYQDYYIHPSAVVVTGGTGPWTMSITMPTITNSLSWGSCDVNCSAYTEQIVSQINNSSTGTSTNLNITTNTGSKLENPIFRFQYLTSYSNSASAQTFTYSVEIPKYVNETIPYSGSPLTIIPSLSAKTCDLSSYYLLNYNPAKNLQSYVWVMVYYQFRNVSPTGDFEIWSYDVVNLPVPYFTTLTKIYENIGGVPNVIDPSYFI